jgi:hypothetical protein
VPFEGLDVQASTTGLDGAFRYDAWSRSRPRSGFVLVALSLNRKSSCFSPPPARPYISEAAVFVWAAVLSHNRASFASVLLAQIA